MPAAALRETQRNAADTTGKVFAGCILKYPTVYMTNLRKSLRAGTASDPKSGRQQALIIQRFAWPRSQLYRMRFANKYSICNTFNLQAHAQVLQLSTDIHRKEGWENKEVW